MRSWYLIYTKPQKEPLVNRQLEDRGLEVFFPVLHLERGYNRGTRAEPFFPHYLFVEADLNSSDAQGLRWLAGVRTIVHFDGQPVVVPEAVVRTLRERLEPYAQRVLRKHEWLFAAGDRVIITTGPFEGMEAIFEKGLNGGQRVQLLLHLLQSWTRVNIDVDHVKPLSPRGTHPVPQ